MNGELHPYTEIHLPTRRKRGRVPNWQAPQRVKPISELIAEYEFAARVEFFNPTRRTRLDALVTYAALNEERGRAATEFGVPHGWRPSRPSFRLEDLSYSSHYRRNRISPQPHDFFDHPTFYRWGKGKGYAPAAIVAQPYTPGFNLAQAESFAREHQLVVHVADAFPSWYSPGKCLVVVWQRGGPGTNGAGRGCWMTPR